MLLGTLCDVLAIEVPWCHFVRGSNVKYSSGIVHGSLELIIQLLPLKKSIKEVFCTMEKVEITRMGNIGRAKKT